MLKATTLFALAAWTVPALAVDPNNANSAARPVLEQLREESRTAKKTASELAALLKSKNADLGKASEHVAAVEKSHAAIQGLLPQLESEAGNWDASKKSNVEQAKKIAELMAVFVNNKKEIADGGVDPAERERLRMNATGVALRAEMLAKTLSKL